MWGQRERRHNYKCISMFVHTQDTIRGVLYQEAHTDLHLILLFYELRFSEEIVLNDSNQLKGLGDILVL